MNIIQTFPKFQAYQHGNVFFVAQAFIPRKKVSHEKYLPNSVISFDVFSRELK